MQTRVENRRPPLVLVDQLEDVTVPALWKDVAVSFLLAALLGLAFLV